MIAARLETDAPGGLAVNLRLSTPQRRAEVRSEREGPALLLAAPRHVVPWPRPDGVTLRDDEMWSMRAAALLRTSVEGGAARVGTGEAAGEATREAAGGISVACTPVFGVCGASAVTATARQNCWRFRPASGPPSEPAAAPTRTCACRPSPWAAPAGRFGATTTPACGASPYIARGSVRRLLDRLGDPCGQRRARDGVAELSRAGGLGGLGTGEAGDKSPVEGVHSRQYFVEPGDGFGEQVGAHHATALVGGNHCVSGNGAVVGASSR